MTADNTWKECRPVYLPDPAPVPEPQPVDGCPVCAEHAELRDKARADGDTTTVIDRSVLLRRHIADGH